MSALTKIATPQRHTNVLQHLAGYFKKTQDAASRAEALANQGLQQSNMSNFAAAERLLSAGDRASPKGNGVIQRLLRNYRAINQLNQHDAASALRRTSRSARSTNRWRHIHSQLVPQLRT